MKESGHWTISGVSDDILDGNKVDKTDPTRWRLSVKEGRQIWRYIKDDEKLKGLGKQSIAEKYFLGLDTGLPELSKANTPKECASKGWSFFKSLQLDDGHWGCEYGGPMFLLYGLIIAMYITGAPIPEEWKIEIIRYLSYRANKIDGGWGIHTEHHSTVYGTAMNYVILRILGMDPDHPVAMKSRGCLQKLGGAIGLPHWGKFWLALLNCYEWTGVNPVPPEFWLLPDWIPFHPWRWWVHLRAVYLPMSYLYGKKFSMPLNDLIESLRQELFTEPYPTIDFGSLRNNVSPADLYVPHSWILDMINPILRFYEKYLRPNWLSEKASQHAYKMIQWENENTEYLCLGPVNIVLHLICAYEVEGRESFAFQKLHDRLQDHLWISKEGLMMQGTNGVQCWDTSFAIQAIVEAGLIEQEEDKETLNRALGFLENCQIRKETIPNSYRQPRLGAWPFSTRDQGYSVSDCTAEAIKAVIMLQNHCGFKEQVSNERLQQAIDVILTMQNPCGGFASYEIVRGPKWVELLNPAEVFSGIMIEFVYPECTTAVLTGLSLFHKAYPDYRSEDIKETIKRAGVSIHTSQRTDGSWYGCWGICFTYASMFALESLASVDEVYENSPSVQKACKFLIGKQMADGGWGESYKSCETQEWVDHEKSQVVNTAWVVIALMIAEYPDKTPIEQGIKLIMCRQQSNGEWIQEGIEGVFNKNCMISYPNYKFYWPIKACGMFEKRWPSAA
ncbi:Lanosterol synthase [Neolecta irregularis DAH-3]|uniref:Terpene cyclase/mutase family member n=1 Tax=Neolecta irregularis (strain DAH-3) TaxID=1198029 RepID=A0A1U7LPL2_NEOID|nr:Lanosterol synthase [Neolecta irregularis DAH-3]|eukprot:OLL24595.1 Lanosterol synthase [Neolecta irregularis DAH-3]